MTEYYEEFLIELNRLKPCRRATLHKFLVELGFVSEDDFYVLDRSDDVLPWQAEELLTIGVKLGNTEVYETEEDVVEGLSSDWDSLVVSYLLASLPDQQIERAVGTIGSILSKFDLAVSYRDKQISMVELAGQLTAAAVILESRQTPAGSEMLALEIEQQYA